MPWTLCQGQPALPRLDRQIIWAAPTNLDNASGYLLTWGTNSLGILGATNTSITIPLQPGAQTLVLRTTPSVGSVLSDPAMQTVRMLRLTLETAATPSGPWVENTNWTWSISPATNNFFRTRLDWSQ